MGRAVTILRDYQEQGLKAFWDALSPDVNRVAIEMATGLGKTVTFAHAVLEWLDQGPRTELLPPPWPKRALILVEQDSLVRQTLRTLEFVLKGRFTIGVVKAGKNETTADVIIGSVDTLARPERRAQITDVGFIVVDECHHAVAPKYQAILKWFGALPSCDHRGRDEYGCSDCMNTGWLAPPVPVLGVSATLARADGQGLGSVFQDMPFSRGLLWGIRKGYLIDMVPYVITVPEADHSAPEKQLDAALAEGIAPEAVVTAWGEKAIGMCDECLECTAQVSGDQGRPCIPNYCPNEKCGTNSPPSTLLFAPLVKSAQAFADAFNAAGVKAEVVHGGMSDDECEAVKDRLEAGTTTVVCNAMKWTEGTDVPRISCVIIARGVGSLPLVIQMVGRGLRPWLSAEAPPREDQRCTVLFVSNTPDDLRIVADLSENLGEPAEGKSLLAMADEWDIGAGIEDAPELYRGPVRVDAWDALVQRSSKAWKYTEGGVPFLPTAKKSRGYVFIVEREDGWSVWTRTFAPLGPGLVHKELTAPDLELAMAAAEDVAQDLGGDIGAMLADKTRPWRKAVPTPDMLEHAARVGVHPADVARIMRQKSSGKAGRLSDLIDVRTATIVLDPVVQRIKSRARK